MLDRTSVREGKKGNRNGSNLPTELMPLRASHVGITAGEVLPLRERGPFALLIFPSLGEASPMQKTDRVILAHLKKCGQWLLRKRFNVDFIVGW